MTNKELVDLIRIGCDHLHSEEECDDAYALVIQRLDELDRIKAALPKTMDGVLVVPNEGYWVEVVSEKITYPVVDGKRRRVKSLVRHYCANRFVIGDGDLGSDEYGEPICSKAEDYTLYYLHPETGLSVEETERGSGPTA